jgi:signal transduction histidine kinase
LTRPFNARIGVVALGGLVAVATALDLGAGSSRELVVDTPAGLASALGLVVTGVTAAGMIAVGLVLVSNARSPGSLMRRLVVPLLVCAAALALNYAVFSVLREAGIHDTAGLKVLGAVTALAIPFAILLGQLRGQLFAVDHLGELIARVSGDPVTPSRMETLLREALGDPLLTLAVYDRTSAGYVDVRGKPLELPENGNDLGVTSVVREGQPVAALIHDPAFLESDGLTKVLAATSFMLLENAHLVEELQASRARIVASAQRERLRLERNLHDGAQQRCSGCRSSRRRRATRRTMPPSRRNSTSWQSMPRRRCKIFAALRRASTRRSCENEVYPTASGRLPGHPQFR